MKAIVNKEAAILAKHSYLRFFVSGFIITFIVEAFSRSSLLAPLKFMVGSPLTFFINIFIVSLTLSLSVFFGKFQQIAEYAIAIAWCCLGVANYIVKRYRMTPFSAEDFKNIPMLNKIASNYVSKSFIITIGIAVGGIVISVRLVWGLLSRLNAKRSAAISANGPVKTRKQRLTGILAGTAGMGLGLYLVLNMGMQTNALSENFENLAEAYEDYGFAYCFSNSLVDVGISKPAEYSKAVMNSIASAIKSGNSMKSKESGNGSAGSSSTFTNASEKFGATAKRPNIIMIQLESFFDPTYIKGLSYSEDPIPVFRSLKDSGASGFLTVPVVGAGTANTEFEILTGMSTDYFGAGEYPYNTVLLKNTCESLPYILRNYGYTSSAVHNNRGTFYNRDTIFSQLGFDNFTPIEYMYGYGETPTNWATDDVLPENIMARINADSGPDFVYTITVQSHGRYPSENLLDDPEITVKADPDVLGANYNVNPVTYYVNQLHAVDEMIGNLIEDLNESGEPAVLVMYGDHLPALNFDEDDLTQPSLYETEYVIWNNFGLELNDKDMTAESMGTYVLSQFGMDSGIIPQFHETFDGSGQYDDVLEMLEYDMLYGKGYIYDAFNTEIHFVKKSDEDHSRPYPATELSYGTVPVTVQKAEVINGSLYVYGSNFNTSSRVVINGKTRDTVYLGSGLLKVDDRISQTDTSAVYVIQYDGTSGQVGTNSNVIYLYGESEEPQTGNGTAI